MNTRWILAAVLIAAAGVVGYALLTRSPALAPAAPSAPAASSTPASAQSYTMAQVAQHNRVSDCWSAINGKVYDLTSWIYQHPGGPEHIIPLCGTDGSAAFNAQHGGQGGPAQALSAMYIGTLSQ